MVLFRNILVNFPQVDVVRVISTNSIVRVGEIDDDFRCIINVNWCHSNEQRAQSPSFNQDIPVVIINDGEIALHVDVLIGKNVTIEDEGDAIVDSIALIEEHEVDTSVSMKTTHFVEISNKHSHIEEGFHPAV